MAVQKQTKFVFVEGMLKWVYHRGLDKYDSWSLVLYPTPESLEICRELSAEGIMNKIKKDDDGWFIRFKRAPRKEVKRGDKVIKVITFDPPVVTLGDKESPFLKEKIGNGSTGIIKLEVFYFAAPGGGVGCAARWMSLKITHLVDAFLSDEEQAVKGLDEQEVTLF